MNRSESRYLFTKGHLPGALDQQGRRLDEAILSLSAEKLSQPDTQLEEDLLLEFSVRPITILRDDIAARTQEEDIDVSQDRNRLISNRSRPFLMKGTRLTFFVPFDGEPTLLELTPSSFTTVFPDGRVVGSEIVVEYSGVDLEAQQMKGRFEANLAQIGRYLQWSTQDVETFNNTLSGRIRSGLAARRAKVEQDHAVSAGLGYKTRTDAPGQAPATVVRPVKAHNESGPRGRGRGVRSPSIEDLVRKGENRRIEFKSSLRWDRRLGKVNKDLQDEVLQTLTGFLNAGGGDLLIGIADDRSVAGIEDDLDSFSRGREDAFMRTVGGLLVDRVGAEFSPFIDVEIEEFDGKRVCRVHVDGAPKPAYVDGSKFFIRSGNATRQLDPKATVDYVQTHWRR